MTATEPLPVIDRRAAVLRAVVAAINSPDDPLCYVESPGRTPTPETDAESKIYAGEGRGFWVRTDFARRLERQRDDLREVLSRLREIAAGEGGLA
jgi:hypothetical protein